MADSAEEKLGKRFMSSSWSCDNAVKRCSPRSVSEERMGDGMFKLLRTAGGGQQLILESSPDGGQCGQLQGDSRIRASMTMPVNESMCASAVGVTWSCWGRPESICLERKTNNNSGV